MSTELVEVEERTEGLALIRAAIDRGVDAGQLEKLVDLYERMKRLEAERAYNAAMVECQKSMPVVVKDASGAHEARYAKLETIQEKCRDIYSGHGFALSFHENLEHATSGMKRIVCDVRHDGGCTKRHEIEVPLDTSGGKSPMHSHGSSVSYGKRYLLCGIFNITIANQDTDGNGGGNGLASMEQRSEVNIMLDELKGTTKEVEPGKFLKWLGIERMEQLTAKGFDAAVRELGARRRQAQPLKPTKEGKK